MDVDIFVLFLRSEVPIANTANGAEFLAVRTPARQHEHGGFPVAYWYRVYIDLTQMEECS
jgi:hypothetical protein